MKEYKFRGRDLDSGEYKYFNLENAKTFLARYDIDYSQIEQLIAKDANGAEVYEGDKIAILGYIDDEGETWRFSQEVIVTAQMTNLEEIEAGLAIKAGGQNGQ